MMIAGGPVRKIGDDQGRGAAAGRTDRHNVIKREKPERSDGISCSSSNGRFVRRGASRADSESVIG
jgi:hypothetical protein